MAARSGRPEKTAMIVARRIVSEIAAKGLRPGDRLPPEKVMLDQYEIGRGTLREALRFLELSGALSLKPGPGGGPTVEKPDASHLMDSLALLLQFEKTPFDSILEARVGLEPMNARLAAARVTDEHLTAMEAAVSRMDDNIRDINLFHETSKEFHDALAWASGNAVFGYLIDAIDGIFEGPMFSEYPLARRKKDLAAHRAVLDAVARRDPDGAEAAMREHMDELAGFLRKKSAALLNQPITWAAL
ncbi:MULTISPECIES: FadR/GntR family transcriptional regulator [Rhodococcus]|uniref:FadR/GntR family transcriptional regulator n=1 Tax=Rhodococcus globerulus TaxID=33008 RepID=UPI001C56967E|nr:FCD domain-containing protein [Rhodococcus globerulus]QXV99914.1 FCD domain-containing protein [Rhodococcus globerulus]